MYLGIYDTMCENMKRAEAHILISLFFRCYPAPSHHVSRTKMPLEALQPISPTPSPFLIRFFHNLKCSICKHHPSYPVLCKCSFPPPAIIHNLQKNVKSINFDYFCIKPHLIFVQMSNYILRERHCYKLKVC